MSDKVTVVPVLQGAGGYEDAATLCMDGNQWCALLGENLQEGTAGFGDTPEQALAELKAELESHGWAARIEWDLSECPVPAKPAPTSGGGA